MNIRERSTVYAYSVSVCMGSFVFGYQLTSFSAVLPFVVDPDEYALLLGSILALSAIFGVSLYRLLHSVFGMIGTFKITDSLTILGCFIGLLNLGFPTQIFSRMILGLAVGINTISIPTYLTSVLPGSMGGPAGTLNQLFITIGIFFGAWMGFIVVDGDVGELGWRFIVGLPIIPAVIRLYTAQNVYPYEMVEVMIADPVHDDMLENYLELIYVGATLEEFKRAKTLPQEDVESEKASFFDPIGQPHRRRILMGMAIIFFNQLSGGAALGTVTAHSFQGLFGGSPADLLRGITYLYFVQIIVTFIAGQFLQQFGRRAFMMEGQRVIIVSLLLVGFIQLFVPQLSVFTGVLTFIQMIGFSLSYGPCSFLIGTQILHDIYYPSTLLWIFIFLSSIVTAPFIQSLGLGLLCLIQLCVQVFGFLYIAGFLVETQGRSRQDVYRDYRNQTHPRWRAHKQQKSLEMTLLSKKEEDA